MSHERTLQSIADTIGPFAKIGGGLSLFSVAAWFNDHSGTLVGVSAGMSIVFYGLSIARKIMEKKQPRRSRKKTEDS